MSTRRHRPLALALLTFALSCALVACPAPGSGSRPTPRRPRPLDPTIRVMRTIATWPPCRALSRKQPLRSFFALQARVARARSQLAGVAAYARRTRDVLFLSCIAAKARALGLVDRFLALEREPLKLHYPPDSAVTARILAHCKQARRLVTEAQHCISVSPADP